MLAIAIVLGYGIWSTRRIEAGQASPEIQKIETSAYYPNCSAARAAGAAPIYLGQPGYRPELDADSDGVACKPYRYQHSR